MLKINQLLKNGTILTFICLLAMGFKVNARQHPFKVLIVASRAKDHLKMIAAAKPFFEELGQKNGFDVDFTDDTSKINDSNLKHYQVFVMLQLAPFDMSYSQQAALQKFAEQGKGWVGIHAAGLTGKEFLAKNGIYWQWFEDFMGEFFIRRILHFKMRKLWLRIINIRLQCIYLQLSKYPTNGTNGIKARVATAMCMY
jgi:hypothetical protein